MELGPDLGIRAQEVIAGFAGGVVYALLQRGKPLEAVSSVVVGALTANYLSDFVAQEIDYKGPAVAFITGLIAMALCQGIIAAGRTIKIVQPKARDD